MPLGISFLTPLTGRISRPHVSHISQSIFSKGTVFHSGSPKHFFHFPRITKPQIRTAVISFFHMFLSYLFFPSVLYPRSSEQAASMATVWLDEEDDALWEHFLCGPTSVVNVLPRVKKVVQKLPNEFLATFFNEHTTEYRWRDNSKTGLECLNRVRTLQQNKEARQRVRQKREPTDIKKAEALFVTCRSFREEQRTMCKTDVSFA